METKSSCAMFPYTSPLHVCNGNVRSCVLEVRNILVFPSNLDNCDSPLGEVQKGMPTV